MPLFEYKCEDCGKKFENLELSKSDGKPACPNCKSTKTTKSLSSFNSSSTKTSCPSGGCCPGCKH